MSNPALLAQWQETIRQASSRRQPLQLRGGGSKDFYGRQPVGEIFDTRAYHDIIRYEPQELFIEVRCGTPLVQVLEVLEAAGQQIACEPPHHFGQATVGGSLSCGWGGPRQAYAGRWRDVILGARIIDGRGRLMNFGGQMIKNVAGYDVSRLLAGALGTLAVVCEVSLRVHPKPQAEWTFVWECDAEKALAQLSSHRQLGLPVSADCWYAGRLWLRFAGYESELKELRRNLGGEQLADDEASRLWHDLREHTHSFFTSDTRPLWRLSVPSTASPSATLIEGSGTLRWQYAEKDDESPRLWAESQGGHGVLYRADNRNAFLSTSPLTHWHHRLKNVFDPQHIFNRGRLWADQ